MSDSVGDATREYHNRRAQVVLSNVVLLLTLAAGSMMFRSIFAAGFQRWVYRLSGSAPLPYFSALFVLLWSFMLHGLQSHDGHSYQLEKLVLRATPSWRTHLLVIVVFTVAAPAWGEGFLRPMLLSRWGAMSKPQYDWLAVHTHEEFLALVGAVMLAYYVFIGLRLVLHVIALRFNPIDLDAFGEDMRKPWARRRRARR